MRRSLAPFLILALLFMPVLSAMQCAPVKSATPYTFKTWDFTSDGEGFKAISGSWSVVSGKWEGALATGAKETAISPPYGADGSRTWYLTASATVSSGSTTSATYTMKIYVDGVEIYTQTSSSMGSGTWTPTGTADLVMTGYSCGDPVTFLFTCGSGSKTFTAKLDNIIIYIDDTPTKFLDIDCYDDDDGNALTVTGIQTTGSSQTATAGYLRIVGDTITVPYEALLQNITWGYFGGSATVRVDYSSLSDFITDGYWYRSFYDCETADTQAGITQNKIYCTTHAGVPNYGLAVAIIDNSGTFTGGGTYIYAKRELGGVNCTIDQKLMPWSKVVYEGLSLGEQYILEVYDIGTATSYVEGLVTISDNPHYIVFSEEAGTDEITIIPFNSTGFWSVDNSTAVNWTDPTLSADFVDIMQTINGYAFGHLCLTILPLVMFLFVGKHYIWMVGMAVTGLSFVINLAIGTEVFSQTVLGIVLFFCIILAYGESDR